MGMEQGNRPGGLSWECLRWMQRQLVPPEEGSYSSASLQSFSKVNVGWVGGSKSVFFHIS